MTKRKYKLYTPGPTEVPDFILKQTAEPLVYHREASFSQIYSSTIKELKKIFMTSGRIFVLTSSGTGAMEAAVSNLINRNDKALVVICGKFGERWRELLLRYGAYVRTLEATYGKSVAPTELERRLKTDDSIKYVFTTLTETSTGAVLDIKSYGDICHKLNRHLIVDCVAGLGADEFRMDDWHVSVAVGASQKALFSPPGLAFVAISENTWPLVQDCRSPRYYFDLTIAQKFADKNQTPWTPAIPVFNGLLTALIRINKKGIVKFWREHRLIAEFVRKSILDMNLELFPQNPSNGLTVIKMPEGVDGSKIVEYIKTKYHMLLANGQVEMRGKVVRIGHMGYFSKPDITKVLKAFQISYHKFSKK